MQIYVSIKSSLIINNPLEMEIHISFALVQIRSKLLKSPLDNRPGCDPGPTGTKFDPSSNFGISAPSPSVFKKYLEKAFGNA